MPAKERTIVESLMAQIEEMWGHFDELFATLGPADWLHRHGPDWTFADVPYHLAYFDQEFIAEAIAKGPDVPANEQVEQHTLADMSAWNVSHFAARPADQTVAQSLAQMHASRNEVRRAAAQLSDADLNRPAWLPLVSARGWRSAGFLLGVCLMHTWNEFMQLRLRMQQETPVPNPAITHLALDGFLRLFTVFLDHKQAAITPFTMVWEFTGPGGGAWTMQVAGGRCTVSEGRATQADLVMTQRPESFIKTFNAMHDLMAAIQSGEIQVSDFQKLATFGQLFPPPRPDQFIEPIP